jgi:PAS domain S-box-containing protein
MSVKQSSRNGYPDRSLHDPELERKLLFWKSLVLFLLPPILLTAFFIFSIAYVLAPLVREKYLDQQREQTISLTMIASNIVNAQRDLVLAGQKTEEAAQRDALERISSLRYGKDGEGYFWVFGDGGELLEHPVIPSLVGKRPEEIEPQYRQAYIAVTRIALQVMESGKSAFVTYRWPKAPDSPEYFTKTSYLFYLPGWKWVIGTGLDMQSIEIQINRFLVWIIVAGILIGLVFIAISFVSAYRLGRSRIDVDRAKSLLSRSEDMTRMREEQFETIFNTSLFGIYIARMDDNTFTRVNEAFTRMVGYSQGEVLGRTALEIGIFSREDSVKLSRGFVSEGSAGMSGQNVFLSLLPKDGDEKAVSLSVVPIALEGVLHAVIIMADITESKRLQEQLALTQKMDTIGQLAGGVAHDFNNMLTGILGSAELLGMLFEEGTKERTFVDVIMNAAQRAADLTSKLLAFSRRGKIVSSPIDAHESIKAAIALLERSVDKRISIKTDLAAVDSTILGDPALMQNAFLNIAINSRDAMPNGGTITFRTRNVRLAGEPDGLTQRPLPAGEYVEISIGDTGIGIPRDVLPKIFDPFFTTKPNGKGTGLGLAAVYGTVKEHQGNVNVYSEVGVGTEFKILLPITAERGGAQAKAENGPIRGSGAILVIDDESVIRSAVYGMLSALGYSVLLAEDGESGIRMYGENPGAIDLVILDIVMPGLGGKDTFLRLKEINPGIKAIFSSGFNPNIMTDEMLSMGILDFIQKPFRLYDLSSMVAKHLGGASGNAL